MLQQIANRVQRDCVNGEDKLALARTSLQSVSSVQALFDLMSNNIDYTIFVFGRNSLMLSLIRMQSVLSPVFSS